MTLFSALLKLSGLSTREAAAFFHVRPDTVKSWSAGRNPAPPGVFDQIYTLIDEQETAAGEGVKIWEKAGQAPTVECGVASDDHEAQGLGWPSVGAQMAMYARMAEMLARECEIILSPRGATFSTAAAADVHDEGNE